MCVLGNYVTRMNDYQLLAASAFGAMVLIETPLLLLMWFGGHRHTLESLANGKPVIHVPDDTDRAFDWMLEARQAHYRPRTGPLLYLGATASAGMLRRWSRIMAALCALAIGVRLLAGDVWWFGAAGYLCLLLAVLYLFDVGLVPVSLRRGVIAFGLAHFPMALALLVSFLKLVSVAALDPRIFYCAQSVSFASLIYLATTRVPSDDIIHQVRRWKRTRTRRRRFFER